MDLDVHKIWVIWKSAVLEVVWVLTEIFAPSEVSKPVPASKMVLLCWGYFGVECFHSMSVVALVVMVKYCKRG